LVAGEDLLDDCRRQQRQAQDAADVGRIDLLRCGKLLDGPVGAGLKQLAPPEGPFIADGWTACVLIVRWSRSSLPSRLYDCQKQKEEGLMRTSRITASEQGYIGNSVILRLVLSLAAVITSATAAQAQDCVGLKGQTLGWNEATIVDAAVAARSGPDQAGQIR
jgi:hypothetical protein